MNNIYEQKARKYKYKYLKLKRLNIYIGEGGGVAIVDAMKRVYDGNNFNKQVEDAIYSNKEKFAKEVKNFIQQQIENQAKQEKKELSKWKREQKQKMKTLSDFEAEAKKEFQKWIRKRDSGQTCISCGAFLKQNGTHASHYFAAGIYYGLIFNETNCHSSCEKCNVFLHGNLLEYRKGLINRYGLEYLEKLESLSNEKKNYKYTREELVEIKNKYQQKNKQ
jgi:hypothetical protein